MIINKKEKVEKRKRKETRRKEKRQAEVIAKTSNEPYKP